MTQVVTELKANDAYQMLGVCQALNNTGNADAATALRTANITLLRCSVLSQPDVDGLIGIHALFPKLRLNVLVLGYTFIPVTVAQQISLIQQLVRLGIVESIEGPNEENLFPTHAPGSTTQYGNAADIKAGTLAWSQTLAAAFPGVRLYSPTLAIIASSADYRSMMPNLAGIATHTAIHKYPGTSRFLCNDDGLGNSPEFQTSLPWYLGWARGATGVAPAVITETGTAGCDPYQSGIVSTLTQAKIVLACVLDCLALGINRVFLYNLISSNDPGNNQGSESHYGLLNPDLTPKAAGAAISRLQTLLYDPGAATLQNVVHRTAGGRIMSVGGTTRSVGQGFVPAPLAVTVAGMDNTASSAGTYLSFRKSDGTDLIMTWNEPIIWKNSADFVPPTLPVTVGWGNSRRYDVIDMMDGSTVSSGTASSVVVPLRGYALAVRLAPRTAN